MPALYKIRPKGEFISTALHFVWQWRKSLLWRIILPSIILFIPTCLTKHETPAKLIFWLTMSWLWISMANQLLVEQAQSEHAFSTWAKEDKNGFYGKSQAEKSTQQAIRKKGTARPLIVIAISVCTALIPIKLWWLQLICLLLLYYIMPFLLLYRTSKYPHPETNFFTALTSGVSGLLVVLLFTLIWFIVGAMSAGLDYFIVTEGDILHHLFSTDDLNRFFHKFSSPRLIDVLLKIAAFLGLLLQGIAFSAIFFFLYGHATERDDHRGLMHRLSTF